MASTARFSLLKLYLILFSLLACNKADAQKVNSLEILEQIDLVLFESEQEHVANAKAVTIADSILNSDLKDITDLIKPQFALIFPDTIGSDIGHRIIYDSNFGDLSIHFDSAFKIIQPFDYQSIPCYVYKDGRNCTFISEDRAISIAKKAFKHKKGIDLKASLNFDYTRKKYAYHISKKLNTKENKAEVVIIDSETGKIISQEFVEFNVSQNGVGTERIDEEDWDPNPVKSYVKHINNLIKKGKLNKVSYPDMSVCGGGLDGYYLDSKLVFINAVYNAETDNFTRSYYLNNGTYIAILYCLHTTEKSSGNSEKMTYSDVTYTIELPVKVTFEKTENKKVVSTSIESELLQELIDCGKSMEKELGTLK